MLVFLGTLAPLVAEAIDGSKISIGPPWFEIAFAMPMLPLVFLLGVGMHTVWRQQPEGSLAARLRIPAIIALLLGIIIPGLFYGRFGLLVIIGSVGGVWLIVSSLLEPIRSLRREKGAAGLPRAVWGMSIAHLGVGVFTLGVTMVSAFNVETDRALSPGGTIEVAGFEFEMRELRNVKGPNYSAIEASIDIRKDGEFIGNLHPQKRQYLVQQNWMTEAGIFATWNKDLFVALGDQLGNDTWSVRVQYKPLIRWIWLGALIMALGGLLAATDRRYRTRETS